MPNPERSLDARQNFQRTTGWAVFTNVNHQMLEQLSDLPAQPLPNSLLLSRYNAKDLTPQRQELLMQDPSVASLFLTMQHIIRDIPDRVFSGQYGYTDQDFSEADRFAFAGGQQDMQFTWYFSALLANATANFFVDEQVITREQKDAFTLHDWADMIGTGWFATLTNQLARTKNGIYSHSGQFLEHYEPKFFDKIFKQSQIGTALRHQLEYVEQKEPNEDWVYATAQLAQVAFRNLRDRMYEDNPSGRSLGCPVARTAAALTFDQMDSPHVQHLIDEGIVRVAATTPDKVTLRQEETAIDRTLAFFAHQLDRYADVYGTPHVTKLYQPVIAKSKRRNTLRARIVHSQPASVNVLQWQASDEV